MIEKISSSACRSPLSLLLLLLLRWFLSLLLLWLNRWAGNKVFNGFKNAKSLFNLHIYWQLDSKGLWRFSETQGRPGHQHCQGKRVPCQVPRPTCVEWASLAFVYTTLTIWVQVKVLKEGKVVSVQSQEIKVGSSLICRCECDFDCEGRRHCDGDEGRAVPGWPCSPSFLLQVNLCWFVLILIFTNLLFSSFFLYKTTT